MSEVTSTEEECCPICLEKFCMKTKLECNHMFCFLCIKGAAMNNSRCPMCRRRVSPDFFITPEICDDDLSVEMFADQKFWYYQAANGWWLYERRDSLDIEKSFQIDPNRTIEKLIAGRIYVLDFVAMMQYPKDNPGRRRRMKRDVFDPTCRGVAGIRADFSSMNPPSANPRQASN